MVGDGSGPTFGLWYDFRQRLPLGGYAGFYVECLEEISEGLMELYREAPYEHFRFWGRLPGVTHEQALENMRLFATEVVPRVHEAVGTKPA